ncbi:hypothetical protein ABIA85_010049 [Bradyrhizobium sp. LA6.10]
MIDNLAADATLSLISVDYIFPAWGESVER